MDNIKKLVLCKNNNIQLLFNIKREIHRILCPKNLSFLNGGGNYYDTKHT